MRTETYSLHCTTVGDGLGNPQPTTDLVNKTVQAGLNFTGNITVQGSIITDVWSTIGTVAAGAALAVAGTWLKIRTNCSAVTPNPDAPTAVLAADNARASDG